MVEMMLDTTGVPMKDAKIQCLKLSEISGNHSVISAGNEERNFCLHSYLCYFNDKFWCMWSQGQVIFEDGQNQHICYSTSFDGLSWEKPQILVGPAEQGKFRYIARGFWLREDNQLRVLISYDEVGKYFGAGLELQSFLWHSEGLCWKYEGTVFNNTISNFPPEKLPSGDWMIARRNSDRAVSFLIGGTTAIDQWDVIPFSNYKIEGVGEIEEPDWAILPDNRIVCLFRDNKKSNRLLRSFSADNGRSWSLPPAITNFPNATSKFKFIRTSRGYYVIVNNPYPAGKTLYLSISYDGMVFTKMFRLSIPGIFVEKNLSRELLQYPYIIEQDGSLLISFSRRKQTVEIFMIELDELEILL